MIEPGITLFSERLTGILGMKSSADLGRIAPRQSSAATEILNGGTPQVDTAVLYRKMAEWTFTLQQGLSTPIIAEQIKPIALQILTQCVPVLRQGLTELKMPNSNLRVALARSLEELSLTASQAQRPLLIRSRSAPNRDQLMAAIPIPPNLSLDLEAQQTDKKMQLFYSQLSPGAGTHAMLAETFTKLQTPLQWTLYLKYMSAEQLSTLMKRYLQDPFLHLWIPRLVLLMPKQYLESVLGTLDAEEIALIAKTFRNSPDTRLSWYKTELTHWVKHFTTMATKFSDEIDAWYESFLGSESILGRDISEITIFDIMQMDELVESIKQTKTFFFTFRSLIENSIPDPECAGFFSQPEMPSTMEIWIESLLNRLSHRKEHYHAYQGCPYAVIHWKAFETRDKYLGGVDDSQNAFEMLPWFDLKFVDQYVEAKLILGAPKEIIDRWRTKPAEANVYVGTKVIPLLAIYAFENCQDDLPPEKRLSLDQLQTILLWKTLRIYNQLMLRDLLLRPEIQRLIRYITEEESLNLSGSPQKKPPVRRS